MTRPGRNLPQTGGILRAMLFKTRFVEGLRGGEIDLAFRQWKRPTVRQGGTLRSAAGLLSIDRVEAVDVASISAADARRAGYESLDELLAAVPPQPGRTLYRIEFSLAGEDPRVALREDAELSPGDLATLQERLERLDRASKNGPWTRAVLELIRDNEAVRAGDLAPQLGRETLAFKTDVRKLKNLGLTESLGTGYRISPRGAALLTALEQE